MDITPHLNTLKQFVYKIDAEISSNAWNDFEKTWTIEEVKRKTILTHPEEVDKHMYFVIAGVQRIYYLDDQDREATLVLSYPHSFVGVIDSFLMQTPSRYYFETLSTSTVLKITYEKLNQLTSQHDDIRNLIQKLTSIALSGVLERMVEVQCFSSEDKFKSLLKRSPHILQHIPHKYIANYLGVDVTNFSKLINQIKI